MDRTFKALSALLSYPTAKLQESIGDISEVLEAEDRIPIHVRNQLHALLMELVSDHLYDLQGRYIFLFDRTRSLSLYLIDHAHHERGRATTEPGTAVGAAELPDYLPWFLEFLSPLPTSEATELLQRRAHIFLMLAEGLRDCQSAYEAVFQALVALSAPQRTHEASSSRLQEPTKDTTAFDKSAKDQSTKFGLASPSAMTA
jgi:nitrate reductase molybdenum cofactor assembly chaperone NarJ/NarW